MTIVLLIIQSAFIAVWGFLKVVAPKTKTKKDDKVLELLSKVADLINIK